MSTKYITKTALLLTIALALNYLERLLPPLPYLPPGFSLGLSNIVLMYCLFYGTYRQATAIMFLKSCFVFLTRGGSAFALSLSGGALALLFMVIFISTKKNKTSYIMLSVIGALMHNTGQLTCSVLLMSNIKLFFYLPVLIIAATLTGTITGVVLKIIIPALDKIE